LKRRLLNLRTQTPLLDVVSYGRGGVSYTSQQRAHIDRTVRRVPEVVIKVSGGARTLKGVGGHMDYIGRKGKLGLETDDGERVQGKGFQAQLLQAWDLALDTYWRQTARSVNPRRRPKLVHNLIFSMPPGTPPDKVLKAVRTLALNEWQERHRYALALHVDEPHPHVHVVLKAVSERGKRLHIRKATLRSWRAQFASNLRELGVAANATERAVRGETRSSVRDGIYRAAVRGESAYLRGQAPRRTHTEQDSGAHRLRKTRANVTEGWKVTAATLRASGDHALADQVDRFLDEMPSPRFGQRHLPNDVRHRVYETTGAFRPPDRTL